MKCAEKELGRQKTSTEMYYNKSERKEARMHSYSNMQCLRDLKRSQIARSNSLSITS